MMRVKEFCEVFEQSENAVYAHNSLYGSKFIVQVAPKEIRIDVDALLRRREFYQRVWLQSHKFYFILSELKKDSEIATILSKFIGRSKGSWQTYIKYNLFSTAFQDRSLLRYEIDDMLYMFWRVSGTIIRRAYREAKKYDN